MEYSSFFKCLCDCVTADCLYIKYYVVMFSVCRLMQKIPSKKSMLDETLSLNKW